MGKAEEKFRKLFGRPLKPTKKRKEEAPVEMPPPDPMLRRLAKWRRRKGTWKVVLIIEGYDGQLTYHCSGALSETFARQLARVETGRRYKESYRHVHVQSIERVS